MLDQKPFDIASLQTAYERGLEPADVIKEVYRRIQEANDPGIFLHLIERHEVLAEVDMLNNCDFGEKPLWGIPFVVKDNIDVAGIPTTAACPSYTYIPENDAFVVSRLRQAGALVVGKTNLDQFATGLAGVRTPHPVPKNAIDPAIVPGGSSSGSAVAVARGMVSFSLGTDTAGSGRVPAALNGIVGLKPSLGAISNSGVVPACRTLDTISIFATNILDAHTVYKIAAEFDREDPYSREYYVPDLTLAPKSLRIGVPNKETLKFFGDSVQALSFDDTLDELNAIGAELVELNFTPFFQVAEMLYEGAWVAERYSVVEKILRENPEALNPVFRQIVEQAENYSSADVFRGFYRLRKLSREALDEIEKTDMLCVPSVPTFYTLDDLENDPIGPNARLGTYTNFVNLLDLCGISVPVSPREDDRPGSVTLLAPAGQDTRIGSVAVALQQRCNPPVGATNWELPEQNLPNANTREDEIEIAVVGAHMAGLPLNYQLTDLDSRFSRIAKTAESYKLYRLSGVPPLRPGLVSSLAGCSIDLEIWAMPKSSLGDFIETIPFPLGIGTITLNSGETVKGFICEISGLTEAEDITSFGGWRNYLKFLSSNSTQSKESDYEKT